MVLERTENVLADFFAANLRKNRPKTGTLYFLEMVISLTVPVSETKELEWMKDAKSYRETEFFWEVQRKNSLRDQEQVAESASSQLLAN